MCLYEFGFVCLLWKQETEKEMKRNATSVKAIRKWDQLQQNGIIFNE